MKFFKILFLVLSVGGVNVPALLLGASFSPSQHFVNELILSKRLGGHTKQFFTESFLRDAVDYFCTLSQVSFPDVSVSDEDLFRAGKNLCNSCFKRGDLESLKKLMDKGYARFSCTRRSLIYSAQIRSCGETTSPLHQAEGASAGAGMLSRIPPATLATPIKLDEDTKQGASLFNSADYLGALPYIQKGVAVDEPFARTLLGFYYYFGLGGVGEDNAMAISLFAAAAEDNDFCGLFYLGLCYLRGDGCKKDEDGAYEKMRLSLGRGYEEAYDLVSGSGDRLGRIRNFFKVRSKKEIAVEGLKKVGMMLARLGLTAVGI